MGSTESKLAVAPSEIKPEIPFKCARVNELLDPRSPSGGIDRTPIQVVDAAKSSAVAKRVCPVMETDPRSPSVGITRTPVREVMRATVGSFARRLGMLFHNDTESKAHQSDSEAAVAEGEEDSRPEELSSTEPLLTPQPPGSFHTHASMLDTPKLPPPQGATSPFVLLQEPEFEVELETEPDISLEEAEEAKETPIHKRMSLSLIVCHEGSTALSENCEDVTNDDFLKSGGVDSETLDKEGHSSATPSITVKSPAERMVPADHVNAKDTATISKISLQSEVVAQSSPEKTEEVEIVDKSSVPQESERQVPSSVHPHHIRCPTIDLKSPSQVVFKPQWLGKGFGGAGQRVRAQAGKGGSSPLALHVAVKKVANDENKGHAGKSKPKGHDGRSPLQTLKETNSPRGRRAQLKLKGATPERRRSHADRRGLTVAKENR